MEGGGWGHEQGTRNHAWGERGRFWYGVGQMPYKILRAWYDGGKGISYECVKGRGKEKGPRQGD